MSGLGPTEEDIVAALETILERPVLVSARGLELLRTIDGMSGRIRRSEEGGIL